MKEIKVYIDCVISVIELPDTKFSNFESVGVFWLIVDKAYAKYLFLGSYYSTVQKINFKIILYI